MSGRKSKATEWLTEEGLAQIEAWAAAGLTEKQIAGNMGVGETSLGRYKKEYPEIVEALKKGKAPADQAVENALYKRAVGYTYEETTYGKVKSPETGEEELRPIKVVTKTVPPDPVSMIFWLKNRLPDRWRDKPLEAGGDDKTIRVVFDDFEERTDGAADTNPEP